jgi:hypothetical protein
MLNLIINPNPKAGQPEVIRSMSYQNLLVSGWLTLTVAATFGPKSIIGIQ